MNYRHAYHAGNFADVLKHIVLALAISHLKAKPQPFRVIDVHAGTGRYDLESEEAGKTLEWQGGIGRLMAARLSGETETILAPYLDAVRALNAKGELRFYPGSPLLSRMLMRPGDTLIANELHPDDFKLLNAEFRRAADTKVLNLDAWVALKSLLPPKERRGLVLIDPPFEAADEFDRVADGLTEALTRFATGIFLVWYPLKTSSDVTGFLRRIRGRGIAKALNVTLKVSACETVQRGTRPGLTETGILVINPPWTLKKQIESVMPEVTRCLESGGSSRFTIEDWALQDHRSAL